MVVHLKHQQPAVVFIIRCQIVILISSINIPRTTPRPIWPLTLKPVPLINLRLTTPTTTWCPYPPSNNSTNPRTPHLFILQVIILNCNTTTTAAILLLNTATISPLLFLLPAPVLVIITWLCLPHLPLVPPWVVVVLVLIYFSNTTPPPLNRRHQRLLLLFQPPFLPLLPESWFLTITNTVAITTTITVIPNNKVHTVVWEMFQIPMLEAFPHPRPLLLNLPQFLILLLPIFRELTLIHPQTWMLETTFTIIPQWALLPLFHLLISNNLTITTTAVIPVATCINTTISNNSIYPILSPIPSISNLPDLTRVVLLVVAACLQNHNNTITTTIYSWSTIILNAAPRLLPCQLLLNLPNSARQCQPPLHPPLQWQWCHHHHHLLLLEEAWPPSLIHR